MKRLHAYALTAAMLSASAYPAFIDPYEDDYPLSTYPMFSSNQGRVSTVTGALAVDANGGETAIEPAYVANSEAMQAMQTLHKSLRAGRHATRDLCRNIAARIAAQNTDYAAATQVVIATRRVDSIRYLGGDEQPISRKVHVRCPIEREGGR